MEENQDFSISEELKDIEQLAEVSKSLENVSPTSLMIVIGAVVALMVLKIILKKIGK